MTNLVRPAVGCSAEQRTYASAALLIAVAAFALRANTLMISSISWDESVYLVTAQRWLLGGLPYVEVWDQHPPGLPALLAVVQLIIPDPILGARLAATLAVIATALLIHRFCTHHLRRPGAGLVGGLLYAVCISRFAGLAANTEVFNNACVTAAAYLLYGAAAKPRDSWIRPLTAAALLGLGLQIKYVVFPEAVLLCLCYLTARYCQQRDLFKLTLVAGSLLLAGCLPTAAVVLYFWLHGALQPFLDANVGANIAYLTVVPPLDQIVWSSANGLAPLAGPLLVIGYTLIRSVRWPWHPAGTLAPEVWILAWGIATLVNVSLPVKFFNHYYFALYPPICLAAAIGLSVAARNRFRHFATGLAILFATALPLWAMGQVRAARAAEVDASREIADLILRTATVDSSLFVYDYDPAIYALTRLPPPTPYVLSAELDEFSYSSHVDGVAEVKRILDASPDIIVLHQGLPGRSVQAEVDELVARKVASYKLAATVQNSMNGVIVSVYTR